MTTVQSRPATIPTYVVIPVKNQLALTRSLVDQLHNQGGHQAIFVFDNGSTDGTGEWLAEQARQGVLEAIDATDRALYEMWNAGVRRARDRDAVCNIAILNNDLVIGDAFCEQLASTLRADPRLWAVSPRYDDRRFGGVQYVRSTFKNGGLAGFAFMARGEAFDHVGFDEALRWWYGDDDFVAQIEALGHRVGLTDTTSVVHVNNGGQTMTYDNPRLWQIEHDTVHMYKKWGHT
jgi:GT2 family glycosyltransferase